MKLDPAAEGPPYLQVAEWLRQGIREGRWKPGEKLPSAPALARDLQVAKMTALRAVQVLQDEGLAVSRVGSGTFVAPPAGGRDFGDIDPGQSIATACLYGLAPEVMAVQVPKLLAFQHRRHGGRLRVRAICGASEPFSWVWRSGGRSAREVPATCAALFEDLENLGLPKGYEVCVRGRHTLPELQLVMFEMEAQGRTSSIDASYQRPVPVKIRGTAPWGAIDAGEAALRWFEHQWK